MPALSSWLESLGLERYAAVFEDNGVDLESLPLLGEGDLESLGVLLGHRKMLLKAIAELNGTSARDTMTRAKPAIPDTAPAEGERRQATVLFSDLSGYTAMNEKLDPEVVAEMVGRIKAEAVKIVESHGGIVNQFVGDEILALFGIPVAHEDDPVRAVRAALALHRMVRGMAPSVEARIGQPLRLHTGIDTGLVVTNLRDQRDGTFGITGDAVNTGARLAAQSPADEVWVSPQTHQRIADYFETQAMPAVALKGKAEPVRPYRVTGLTKTQTRFEAAQRRGLTGYTGRAQEFSALLACLEKTQRGDGQFVAVIGEAGAGKSRLLFEFRNSLPRDKVGSLEGRCQSYGIETPYLPFLDALRRALDLREEDSPEQLLDKAIANVRAVDPALESFLPHYLHLLSIPSEHYPMPAALQGAERKRAFEEALAAFFTLAAKRQPLAIVLEDWHWVDATSDAVLKHLVGLIADYPLMIVLLCRPEYELNWAALSQLTRIVLKPLSIADTGAMACTALTVDSMPEELTALIHERTAGNPLFIEEVCHTLVEESIIKVSAGRATLTRRIDTVQLPDTVQAVIRSRVDRLDKEAQGVLQLASVIGREFARTLLERVAVASDRLGQTLDTLRTQDLIRQVRVLPEPEYIFKHVLTQVVVYETLLLMRRQTLHEMVGQAIEEIYADRLEEHYESLAYHYQRSDNKGKAIQFLELAGDKAKTQYVLQQTVKNYQLAIELLEALEQIPDRMRTYIDIAVKWADLIQPTEQLIAILQRSKSYAQALEDSARFALAANFLGQMFLYLGKGEQAIQELEPVIRMADVLEDQDRVGSSYRALGQILVNMGRNAEGLEYLERARPIVRATQNGFEEGCALGLISVEYALLGRFAGALEICDEGIRVARQRGARSIEAWHLGWWRGWVHCMKGDWREAIAACDDGIQLSARIENVWSSAWASIVKGYALFMSGQRAAGLSLTAEATGTLEQTGALVNIAVSYGLLADMQCIERHADEAMLYAEKALSHLHLGSSAAAEPRGYRVRAMAQTMRPHVNWGLVHSDMAKCLSGAKTFNFRPELAIGQLRYTQLLCEEGDLAEARKHLAEADKLFAAMDMTWWSAQAAKLRTTLFN